MFLEIPRMKTFVDLKAHGRLTGFIKSSLMMLNFNKFKLSSKKVIKVVQSFKIIE